MAIKKNKSYRVGFLGFFTIFCYCLCVTIGIVWASVGFAFATGQFDEEKIYPNSLYFEYDALPFEDVEKNRNDCLRITGITEEIKEEMIAQADQSEKVYLEQNILVDRPFIVRCTPEDATVLEVNLICSDPSIATVPETVNIGEPVIITPTLVNGVNKGGFIEIRASATNGTYSGASLKVLIDVPVNNLGLSLPSTFESEIVTIVENPPENPPEEPGNEEPQAQSLYGLESVPVGERVYYMYEGDETTLQNSISPTNAINPTLNSTNTFSSYLKDNKVISYFLDNPNGYGTNFQLNSETGEITANKEGIYKIWAKVLKTYDDEIYVSDYKFEYDFETVIPEEKLVGRYVYSYIYIEVKPIVLEKITVSNSPININLFESVEISAINDLHVQLFSNRNETNYFASDINKLSLVSSDPNVLHIEKISGTDSWRLTAVSEPIGLSLILSHPDYPDITYEIENISINIIEISKIELEGTGKQSISSTHNDMVEVNIQKTTEEGTEVIVVPGSWDFSQSVTITSSDPNNPVPTYSMYKIFATGVYNNDEYKDEEFVNEQGNAIITLGAFYKGIGCEVTNTMESGAYTFVEALSRGTIRLYACIIKTDINGNPVDMDGEIITTESQSYVKIAESDPIDLTVKELLRTLTTKTNVTTLDEGGNPSEEEVEIAQGSKVIVENGSKLDISLIPNSNGAIIDAIKYDLLKLEHSDYLFPTITENNLSVSFENAELTNLGSNYADETLSIQVYTGSKYEVLKTISFRVVEVPVSEIKINTNAEPDVEGGKYYTIIGNLDIVKDNSGVVTELSTTWGKVVDYELVAFELLEPTFTASDLDYGAENPIVPKPLGVTNKGYEYRSLDTSILQTSEDSNSTLIVKRINEEVRLQVISAYDDTVTDEITLKFTLPEQKFKWTELQGATITKSELEAGFKLNIEQIALEIATGVEVIGSDKNTWIKGNQMIGDSNSIKFKISEKDNENLVMVDVLSTNDYYGYVAKFKDSFATTGTFIVTAYIETIDGLIFSKDYEFTIIE